MENAGYSSSENQQVEPTHTPNLCDRCKHRLGCANECSAERKFVCPFHATEHCEWRCSLDDMKTHIRYCHKDEHGLREVTSYNIHQTELCNFTAHVGYWYQALLALDQIFFLFIRKGEYALCVTIMYVGDIQDAQKYQFVVGLKSDKGSLHMQMVCPHYIDVSEANWEMNCVQFDNDFVATCINPEDKLYFTFSVFEDRE